MAACSYVWLHVYTYGSMFRRIAACSYIYKHADRLMIIYNAYMFILKWCMHMDVSILYSIENENIPCQVWADLLIGKICGLGRFINWAD